VIKSHKGVRSDVCLGGKQTFLFRRARNKAANKEGLTMGKQLAADGARGCAAVGLWSRKTNTKGMPQNARPEPSQFSY